MKIENLKVYDLENSEKRINVLRVYLRNYV